MTRGCRAGFLTRAALIERLRSSNKCRDLGGDEVLEVSHQQLLGHCFFYELVTEQEYLETVEREETTIPCYLRPLLAEAAPVGFSEAIERYVIVASKMYRRGSLLANYVAMRFYGGRLPEGERQAVRFCMPPRGSPMAEAVQDFKQFFCSPDVRGSALKQLFLPERWPTENEYLHPGIEEVLLDKHDVLPTMPADWEDIMPATGWDNVINRMATKYSGNVQVHCRANLIKRTADWLATTTSLHGGAPVPALGETLKSKLRPLTVHDDDWGLLLHLRMILGASEEEPVYPPTGLPPFNDSVLALHAFLVRHGARESAYLPISRHGRKYSYLDAKIVKAMLVREKKRKRDAGTLEQSRRRQRQRNDRGRDVDEGTSQMMNDGINEQTAVAPRPASLAGQSASGRHWRESDSLGSLLGITPREFNARRRHLRQEIIRRLHQPKKSGKPPNDFRRRLKRKRRRLGAGQMHPDALIQSMETDGVGARLCIKIPTDMEHLVRPLPERASTAGDDQGVKKRRKTADEKEAEKAEWIARRQAEEEAHLQQLLEKRQSPETPFPVMVTVDEGRSKLSSSAISVDPLKKPESEVFTRSRYYTDMRYWRQRGWSRRRTTQPYVAEALAEMSRAGGLRNCSEDLWDATLETARQYEDILDAEFVEHAGYAVWRMRMFRGKRASLDRATYGMLSRALKGQPTSRGLHLGVGNGSFPSTGRGELSAPTTTLRLAFKRAVRLLRRRDPHREVVFRSIHEYGTTMCCSSCGSLTTSPMVRVWSEEENRMTEMTRRSRRLRLCAECTSTAGRCRDRDVQGARNLLWIQQHEYFHGPNGRPWYLTLRGRRDMQRQMAGV